MPKTPNIEDYLKKLPAERREALEAILKVIRKNIDKKFEEGIQLSRLCAQKLDEREKKVSMLLEDGEPQLEAEFVGTQSVAIA